MSEGGEMTVSEFSCSGSQGGTSGGRCLLLKRRNIAAVFPTNSSSVRKRVPALYRRSLIREGPPPPPPVTPPRSATYADEHLREGSARVLGHVDGGDHPVPLLPPQTFGAVASGAGEEDDGRRRREGLLQLPSRRNFVLLLRDL